MAAVVPILLMAGFVGLVLLLVVAIRHGNVPATVNTLVALAVALLSVVLASGNQPPWNGPLLTPELPLWVVIAGVLHSIGMLGYYESIWWWDHLTHTVSATLVTALLYAGLIVATRGAFSPTVIATLTVASTFVVGVFWELIELGARAVGERYDIEPVLVHYGWRDTAFDMGFNLVGALLVVALDLRLFVDVVSQL